MRRVHVTRTLADAYLAAQVLAEAGIHATLRNEQLVGATGSIPATPEEWPQVWVGDDEAEAAAQVLRDRFAADEGADGLDAIAADDDAPSDPRAQEAMSDVFAAAQTLARHPGRGAAIDSVHRLRGEFAQTTAPFGIDQRTWDAIGTMSDRVLESAAAQDDESVQAAAMALRDHVGPLVGRDPG